MKNKGEALPGFPRFGAMKEMRSMNKAPFY
jgi:hypothetical protein